MSTLDRLPTRSLSLKATMEAYSDHVIGPDGKIDYQCLGSLELTNEPLPPRIAFDLLYRHAYNQLKPGERAILNYYLVSSNADEDVLSVEGYEKLSFAEIYHQARLRDGAQSAQTVLEYNLLKDVKSPAIEPLLKLVLVKENIHESYALICNIVRKVLPYITGPLTRDKTAVEGKIAQLSEMIEPFLPPEAGTLEQYHAQNYSKQALKPPGKNLIDPHELVIAIRTKRVSWDLSLATKYLKGAEADVLTSIFYYALSTFVAGRLQTRMEALAYDCLKECDTLRKVLMIITVFFNFKPLHALSFSEYFESVAVKQLERLCDSYGNFFEFISYYFGQGDREIFKSYIYKKAVEEFFPRHVHSLIKEIDPNFAREIFIEFPLRYRAKLAHAVADHPNVLDDDSGSIALWRDLCIRHVPGFPSKLEKHVTKYETEAEVLARAKKVEELMQLYKADVGDVGKFRSIVQGKLPRIREREQAARIASMKTTSAITDNVSEATLSTIVPIVKPPAPDAALPLKPEPVPFTPDGLPLAAGQVSTTEVLDILCGRLPSIK